MKKVQIVWKWKKNHCPQGEVIKWNFAAHGARFNQIDAIDHVNVIKSHGKIARILVI